MHPEYLKESIKRKDDYFLDKSTLEYYFKSNASLFIAQKKVHYPGRRFDNGEKGLGAGSFWGLVLDYAYISEKYEVDLRIGQMDNPFTQ